MKAFEVNFDGLVGPTHNYAGLSVGNIASLSNANIDSRPMEAALQGLDKMKALYDMGYRQGIIAPLERPHIPTLRSLGFSGTDQNILQQAQQQAPQVFSACCSASSMWTANACTTSPSIDSADNKVHFTPANLVSKFHRAIEWPDTGAILKAIFNNSDYFVHHQALPSMDNFGDEGAANHSRLCDDYGDQGLQFFVYGKQAFNTAAIAPHHFPARQSLEASEAVARLHQLQPENCVFAQQNPEVIDQGVFHNDVIAVANQNALFYHQQAFLNTEAILEEITAKYKGQKPLDFICVTDQQVPLIDAIQSYLFNSQLLALEGGGMRLICPGECRENPRVSAYLDTLLADKSSIKQVEIYDVKQSMRNGGGPACLRQRVVVTEAEYNAINPNCLFDHKLYTILGNWVRKHYRETLAEADLADPQLLIESRTALDELTEIMHLGSVYPFQG
jgi:succinylarginine dihydrolase